MAIHYTDVAAVVAQLGWIDENGVRPILDEVEIPKASEIVELIEAAESEIESRTMTAWRDKKVIQEPHDTPQSYMKWHGMGMIYQMRNRYIRPWDAAEGDAIEIFQGGNDDPWLDIVANEGVGPLDGDYYTRAEAGLLFLHTNFPAFHQTDTVRISYRYGQTDEPVPAAIRRATTLLAATYAIEAGFDWTYSMVENSKSMSNQEKAVKWEERANKLAASFRVNAPIPQY